MSKMMVATLRSSAGSPKPVRKVRNDRKLEEKGTNVAEI